MIALPGHAQVSVPLTIQEALYPNAQTQGISRTQDPVTVGIPLADGANIHDVSQLGLSGASAGQFRALGLWPSGNIKWVLVDTEADITANLTNTSITLTTGSGNFGGANLAIDNGSSISINTGAAQFVIRKKNFNLFDQVVVNGTTLVKSNTSAGLVLMGPPAGQVSCGVCTNSYSSSNDPNSTAIIEENGPVRAAIKVDGSHVDAQGNIYMHYTVRMHFFRGKTFAKVEVILRNADETNNPNGDFNSAYKGYASYEARVTPAIGGSRTFNIGTDSSNSISGSFTGSEDAYLYQAYSNNGEVDDWNAPNCASNVQDTQRCVVSYIARNPAQNGGFIYAQDGYQIVHGNSVLASGDHTKYPHGWADLSDATGAGIEVGVYQLSAYWPKSLQLKSGGSEVRIGIWPDQSLFTKGGGQPYYQAWPTYSVHDLFFDFHGSALSSPSDTFLAFQHHLLGRASISQYNNTGVFFYPLVDPAKEDSYYKSINVPCCLQDLTPRIFRRYDWPAAGGGNQHEMRWSYLRNFLERGMPGRYLFAAHFYRLVTEHSFPRSDGFSWRDHPITQLDYLGFPTIASANNAKAHRDFIDGQHAHWYGMTDYYFMTGDETIKDQILDGVKDDFLNPSTTVNQGKMWDTRDVGGRAMGDGRLYQALMAFGDPDALKIPPIVNTFMAAQVFAPMQVSGFGTAPQGSSYTRGMQWGCCTRDTEPPNFSGRVVGMFHEAILEEGLYELAQSLGPSWSGYQQSLDLAYGESQYSLNEGYGSAKGQTPTNLNSGFRYLLFIDEGNTGLKYFDYPGDGETNWFHFYTPAAYAGDMSWQQKFEWYLQRLAADVGMNWAEYSSHMVQAVVDKVINGPTLQLSTVSSVSVVNNGGGSYTLSWIVPPKTSSYRIKYTAQKNIVDWIGFDPGANKFIGDPTSTWPWYASTEVPNPPPPQAPGTLQKVTINGLDQNQVFHFAVKAYVGGNGGDHTPPVVSVTSPSQNANVSGSITLSANATDDVAVAWVQFSVDGNPVGSHVLVPPYSLPWNSGTVPNGTHTISATASDLAGNLATASVQVTVNNSIDHTPPTVVITAPAPNSQLSGTVTVSATASDDVGVAWVAFQVDGQALGGQITAPPYSQPFDTTLFANGPHVIKATASDFAGNLASTSVPVTVNNTSKTPQVIIVSPQNNSQVSGTITISANTNNITNVSLVWFAVDGVSIGSLKGNNLPPPYNYTWNTTTVTNGTHTVRVTACYSSLGTACATASVSVTVSNGGNQPPQVTITSPAAGKISGTVVFSATVTAQNPITNVAFQVDQQTVANLTSPPYQISLDTTKYNDGNHLLGVVATDSKGGKGTATVAVTISNHIDKQPPTVSVTSPTNNANLTGAVQLAANATDDVGVRAVQFMVDGSTVGGQLTQAPYVLAWDSTTVLNGSHTISAQAWDFANNTAISKGVPVTVSNTQKNGSGEGTPGVTCPADKWCQTWPLKGLSPNTPTIRGWNRLLFDSKLGRAVSYLGDNQGTFTFSTNWWSYGYTPKTITSGSAWEHESSCGERGWPNPTAGYDAQVLLGSDITLPTSTVIQLSKKGCNSSYSCSNQHNSTCRACLVNPAGNFNAPKEVPTMWVDDEELEYCNVNQDPTSPNFAQMTVGTWTGNSCTPDPSKRGIRGTTATTHVNGTNMFQGCPVPQGGGSQNNGNPVSITDHMPSRHPWRNMAYDGKRGYWWQVTGKPENGEFQDTWYYNPAGPAYVEVTNAGAPGRTDGSMEYDPDHDVLILYGGSHSGLDTATTWIMCLDSTAPPTTLASYGCTSKPQTMVWNLVVTLCSGTRWDGTACNSTTPAGPGFRRTQSLTYDTGDHKFIMFGGTSDGPPAVCKCPDNPAGPPPYTWSRANCPSEPNDVWMYDVPTRTWTQLANTGDVPAPSRRPAIAHNSNLGYFALWEGPVPNGGASVGKFEQGLYTLTIDSVGMRATWKLTSVGTNGDPQPLLQYSQMSPNCQTPNDPRFDQCDHASENLVYDPANHVFIYTDLDHLVGQSVIQTWQLPEDGVK